MAGTRADRPDADVSNIFARIFQEPSNATHAQDLQAVILLRDEVTRLSRDLVTALERLSASTSGIQTQNAHETESLHATIRDLQNQLQNKDRQLSHTVEKVRDITAEKNHLEQQNLELDLQRKRARTMAWELAVQLDDFLFTGAEEGHAQDHSLEYTAGKRRWEDGDDDSRGNGRAEKRTRRGGSSETEGSWRG